MHVETPLSRTIRRHMGLARTGRCVKPLIVTGNDPHGAQRAVLGGAAETNRRLVRFDHPLAPAARGALWLATCDMVPKPGTQPKALIDAIPAAGMAARTSGRVLLCLAPSLHTWDSKDLLDLSRGLYQAHQRALPVVFAGFGDRTLSAHILNAFYFSEALYEFLTFHKAMA